MRMQALGAEKTLARLTAIRLFREAERDCTRTLRCI